MSHKILGDLIDIYKSEPCLWDTKHEDYRNRLMKSSAYVKLVRKLKEIDPQANRLRVVKKINSLRTNYRKELKKVREYQETGLFNYVPNLWYFDRMEFLSDSIKSDSLSFNLNQNESRLGEKSIKTEYDSDCNIEESPNDSANWSLPKLCPDLEKDSPSNSTRSEESCDPLDERQKNFEVHERRKKSYEMNEDKCDTFGKHVAAKLRDMDKKQRIFSERIINQALCHGELGILSYNSFKSLFDES